MAKLREKSSVKESKDFIKKMSLRCGDPAGGAGGGDYWKEDSAGHMNTVLIFNRRWSSGDRDILKEAPPLARKCMLSMTRENNIEENRKDLAKYFILLMEMVEELEKNGSQYREEYLKDSIFEIKQSFDSFRKLFCSVDCLPESFFSLHKDKPRTEAYHVFHSYLEIHWLHLNFMIKYIKLDQTMQENDKMSKLIDSEINFLLFSITTISYKLFCKNGHNLLFSCDCLSKLWKIVVELVKDLNKRNLCSEFWYIFNQVMNHFVEKKSSKYPVSFPINMLKHVSQIRNEVIPNFQLIETILKAMDCEDLSEVNLRLVMSDIYHLTTLWKPKADVIIMLWEYFHKKLNSAYSIPNDNNFLKSFEKLSISNIVINLKKVIDGTNLEEENSFLTFLKMLGSFLKFNYSQMQMSQCQRLKGRILPKFTANKIEALNDVGFRNFCILYLTMAISTDLQEICPKLLQLLNQLNLSNMENAKQCLLIKVEMIIMYLYVDQDKSITNIVEPLVAVLSEYSSLRDHSSNKLMSCACSGMHDIIDVSTTLNNGEAAFIGPWLSKYLSLCPYSDLVSTLSTLTFLVTKTRQIRRYHGDCETGNTHNVELLVSNLFSHVLATLKSLFCNQDTASAVADVAIEFVKMTIENDSRVKTNDLLKMFIQSDRFNERAAHHFMANLLEQDVIINLLESDSCLNEALLIECWVKCALLHDESCSQSPPSLTNLQHLKHVKKVLPFVDFTNLSQNHLSLLFFGLGCLWKKSQNFQEKCQLKNVVNQYLGGLDKLLINIVKTSTSSRYISEVVMSMGTLFIHCSSIIYYRAKPSCLLHSIISSLLLPPQMYVENKRSSLVTGAVCRSWFMFMCGLFQLDKDNDPYIETTLRDMLLLYVPHFVALTGGDKYEILHRVLPDQLTHPYARLEVFILGRLATSFVSCRGKQTHQHASKALAIIHNLCGNVNKMEVIIKNTFFAIFEQCMFADSGSLSSKLAHQILETINSNLEDADISIKTLINEIITSVCQKYFSFHSNQFFKLLLSLPAIMRKNSKEIIPYLETEVQKLERMRGVQEDVGLRNGLKNLMS